MAKLTILLLILLPLFVLSAIGARLGARTPVKNVQEDKEVQDLGRYCVQEYNKLKQNNNELLVFTRVVRAETQVVSGIKYYLDISASSKSFEAVLVVKPWLHSKQLLNFAPHSPNSKNTK